jgi:hypothetical protein
MRRRLSKEAAGLSASGDPDDARAADERRTLIARIDAMEYTE